MKKIHKDGKKAPSGNGYITFETQEGADKAIKDLKGVRFISRCIGMEYTFPLPGCSGIVCGNLSEEIDEAKIRAFFHDCGSIKEVTLQKDKGIANVSFENFEGLRKAGDKSGNIFLGRPIRISYAPPPISIPGLKTVLITGLSEDVDDQKLKEFFSDCSVKSIRFITHKTTKKKTGVAHVYLDNVKGFELALQKSETVLMGRKVFVYPKLVYLKPAACVSVIVEGMPLNMGRIQLREFFLDCGPVKNISLLPIKDQSESSTRKAIVEFEDPVFSIDHAIRKDGNIHSGHTLSVRYGRLSKNKKK